MNKITAALLLLIVLATASLSLNYVDFYKIQKSHKSLERLVPAFMRVKMYQLRQGKMASFLGIFSNNFESPELKKAKREYKIALNKAVRDRLIEVDLDPNDPANIRGFKGALPNSRSTYAEARAKFSNAAVQRWISSYSRYTSGKGIDALEGYGTHLTIANKMFDKYFDDLMLQSTYWFRDAKGDLHIPNFLLKKYEKEYLKEDK